MSCEYAAHVYFLCILSFPLVKLTVVLPSNESPRENQTWYDFLLATHYITTNVMLNVISHPGLQTRKDWSSEAPFQ